MRQLRMRRAAVAGLLLLAVSGCSGYRSFRAASYAEEVGDWDRAVLEYLELTARDPSNLRYRTALLRAKTQASNQHFEAAKRNHEAGILDRALIDLQQAVQLDPTNQYARVELEKVLTELEAARNGSRRETIEEMKQRSRDLRAAPPLLNPRSPEPINLEFSQPRPVKQIYQALGKAFGINILTDPQLRDSSISIELNDVTAQDALEILMRAAGHFYKVLDEHTILVVADTRQNRQQYEDLIIQTFFLSNADVREAMTLLRSLIDSRKIASNEQLNAITIRDTADKVKIAERIIHSIDKSKAEVVVDVELLQINTSKLRELGASLSNYQLSTSIDSGAAEGEKSAIRFNDLQFLDANDWLLTIPSFLFDFVKTQSEGQTLAKPQLRISEGEKARLSIGDRVPIPVTSFNTANTVGSNIVPITSFQYQEVGIRIEIEPRVHHNEEITLKVSVEVSNLSGSVGNQPIIGSRNIETTIRLKDGETNFLAGLIRTDETSSERGLPGLSDVPLLGRLFSRRSRQKQRTDIVLTLTPHLIRRADITEEDLEPIWVGTDANPTIRGGSPRVESDNEGPFDEESEATGDAENLRQRIERLPRGLRNAPGEEATAEPAQDAPPQGQDLSRGVGVPTNPLDRRPPNLSSIDSAAVPLWAAPAALAARLALPAVALAQPPKRPGQSGRRRVERPAAVEAGLLISSSHTARVGDTIEIALGVLAESEVSHVPLTLRFDNTRLEFVRAEVGGWLAVGAKTRVISEAGGKKVIIGASRLGRVPGATGQGEALRVVFRAIETGSAAVEIDAIRVLAPDLGDRSVKVTTGALSVGILPEDFLDSQSVPAAAAAAPRPGSKTPEIDPVEIRNDPPT